MTGYLGRPVQGGKFDITERNVFGSGADLTVTASLTDDWGTSRKKADLEDSTQFALLTSNDSVLNDALLNDALLFSGAELVTEYIRASEYDYPSIERLLQFKSSLSRQWEPADAARYHARTELNWNQSRTEPFLGGKINYSPGYPPEAAESESTETVEDTPDDEDPLDDDNPFGDEEPSGDDLGEACGPDDPDYACGSIRIDDTWHSLLTEDSNALDLTFAFNRDSRDNPISPSSGTLLHAEGLYAIEFGRKATRVLKGEVGWRYYLRLHPNFVWAQQFSGLLTASLRKNRDLPEAYWIELGGEGSVRGRRPRAHPGDGRGASRRQRAQRTAHQRRGVRVRPLLGPGRCVAPPPPGPLGQHGGRVRVRVCATSAAFRFRFDVGWSRDPDNRRNNRSLYFSIGQAF